MTLSEEQKRDVVNLRLFQLSSLIPHPSSLIPHPSPMHPLVDNFIADAGNLTQSFGLGRVAGQIYAYLYFSREPRNLGDMQESLGISKGSASTVVRQLEQWGAVRKVWIKGDRKDYYEANDWFGKMLKNVVVDVVGSKLSAYGSALNGAEGDINFQNEEVDEEEKAFIMERLEHLRKFQNRAQNLWNSSLFQHLLK